MQFSWTGYAVFGMMVYGHTAMNSPTLSFDINIFFSIIAFVFVIETIVNIASILGKKVKK